MLKNDELKNITYAKYELMVNKYILDIYFNAVIISILCHRFLRFCQIFLKILKFSVLGKQKFPVTING